MDFSQDPAHWASLSDDQRTGLLRLLALFLEGEESVTVEVLPLLKLTASNGRLDEEMYLTSFLFEEAKHVDFFARFLTEISHISESLDHLRGDSYRRLSHELLPEAMGALWTDSSPRAQGACIDYVQHDYRRGHR